MSKQPPTTYVYVNIGRGSSRDSPTFTSADVPHSASSLPSSRDSAGINPASNVTLQSMSSQQPGGLSPISDRRIRRAMWRHFRSPSNN